MNSRKRTWILRGGFFALPAHWPAIACSPEPGGRHGLHDLLWHFRGFLSRNNVHGSSVHVSDTVLRHTALRPLKDLPTLFADQRTRACERAVAIASHWH